jgi:hypothetical protein
MIRRFLSSKEKCGTRAVFIGVRRFIFAQLLFILLFMIMKVVFYFRYLHNVLVSNAR